MMSAPMGREADLAACASILGAVTGGPVGLVLTGPAGIGKTTLWRGLLADARRRGFIVLESRAVEAEAQLAFGGLADLLNPVLDRTLDRLPAAQRLALELALQRVPVGVREPPPLAVSLGTLAAISMLAESSPVIIAVDDMQWLDAASTRVLRYALHRVAGLPVGLVATARFATADSPSPPLAPEIDGAVHRHHLGPLDIDAIGEVVRQGLGLSLRRPAIAWIHAASGGNPFIALELARAAQGAGPPVAPDVFPLATATDALVQARLASLPGSVRWPLAAAAALGRPTIEILQTAYEGAGEAIETACQAGVVEPLDGRIRFTHPLLAAGAYGGLDPTDRRRLHGRLAAVLADPEERARHLALSTDEPTATVASELELAAAHAGSRGASDAGAELALQAARHTPRDDTDALCRRTVAAGGYLIRAGDPSRAEEVLGSYVTSAKPGPGRADALRVLAEARVSHDWGAKAGLLGQALDEAGQNHLLRSQILEALANAEWFTVGDALVAQSTAAAAVTEAEAQDDPAGRCTAYCTAVHARVRAGEPVPTELLDRAMALAPRVEYLQVFRWPAFCQALTDKRFDRLGRAEVTMLALRERAVAAGDWDAVPLISLNLSEIAYRLGSWETALGLAVDAERDARVIGQGLTLAYALCARARVEAGLGREADARRAAAEALAGAREIGAMAVELDCRATRGLIELTAGDPARATDELRLAIEPLLASGFVNTDVSPSLPLLAEALAATDRAQEATALLAPFEELQVRLDRPSGRAASARVRGIIAAAGGDEQAAMEAFAAALAQHDRVAEPFEQARTLLAQGESLRRFRRRGQARDALHAALAVFEQLGANPWVARTTAELARTGHREAGASLTATERQVAELVAAGRTNREVAEALFMSPHTVEAHLTRIYRALGVRRRTDLARAFAEPGALGRGVADVNGNEGHG